MKRMNKARNCGESAVREDDRLRLYDAVLDSRLLLGTARYPTPRQMQQAIHAGGAAMVTVALRRQDPANRGGEAIWQLIRESGCRVLPNTAGCRNADEAVTLAEMSRELFETEWIKLEITGDDYNLQPDPFELVAAAATLTERGFKVLPYCTDDLVLCRRLVAAGCRVLMPWGAPIGTGQGLLNRYALRVLRHRLPETPLIIDAGIGAPSQAAEVMEMGFDAVLLNTAVALARDPVAMAAAFGEAVRAGRRAHQAGLIEKRQTAEPSTPAPDLPFWKRRRD